MKNNIIISEIDDFDCLEESQYIFTSKVWLDFLQRDKKGTPLVLKVVINDKTVYFVSLLFKKGIKMCGSPFEGWNTPYMGFININTLTDEEKHLTINKTVKYLKRKKNCWYIQICDWNINLDFVKKYKYKYEIKRTYFKDISCDEGMLLSSFRKDVRKNIKYFSNNRLQLREEEPNNNFVTNYYNQLVDVFGKNGLSPSYSKEKVLLLMNTFSNSTNNILLESVWLPGNDICIASGVYFIYKKRLYSFGSASYREYQHLRPNEYVRWHAMRKAKEYGCTEYDLMGFAEYKEKFRPILTNLPVLYFEKVPFIHYFKNIFKKRFYKSIGKK